MNASFERSPIDDGDEGSWVGQILAGRYRVDAPIGRGGMGLVYAGTHRELGKRVAIKRLGLGLTADHVAVTRFRREAIAASRIESPYVVQVFDWGIAPDGGPFIVMELLSGRNLRSLLEEEGRLEPTEAVHLASQILQGLQHIHQAGVLHRDLKPENVFLCAFEQATPFVKLLDFGISKQLTKPRDSTTLTHSGMVLGTAAYMSPEQATGDVELDIRSDLYSLGALLYECLTGTQPHRGRTYESLLVDICTRDADDVRIHCPLISAALATVIKCAMSRDRSARYENASKILEALRCAVPELSVDSGTKLRTAMATTASSLSPSVSATPRATNAQDNLRDRVPHGTRRLMNWGVAIAAALSVGGLLVQRVSSQSKLNGKGTYSGQTRAVEAANTNSAAAIAPPTVASLTDSPPSSAAPERTPSAERFNPAKVGASLRMRTESSRPQHVKPRPSRTGAPTTAPEINSGVAGELKLRRTMP